MRCIRCGHDNRYRDLEDGRCANCNQPFAFYPRKGDPLSDKAFERPEDGR